MSARQPAGASEPAGPPTGASSGRTGLPPYSGDNPRCIKCGHEGARTTYRPAIHGEMARWNGDYEYRGPLPERLERECSRCGFQWDEALADATPTPEPAA